MWVPLDGTRAGYSLPWSERLLSKKNPRYRFCIAGSVGSDGIRIILFHLSICAWKYSQRSPISLSGFRQEACSLRRLAWPNRSNECRSIGFNTRDNDSGASSHIYWNSTMGVLATICMAGGKIWTISWSLNTVVSGRRSIKSWTLMNS